MKIIRKRKIDKRRHWSYKLAHWNNLDNPFNLNGIWKKINIENLDEDYKAGYKAASRGLNFDIPGYNDQKYLISLYLTSDSVESGLIFRPLLCKYCGWDDDEVEFYDTQINESVLKIFMKGLGLEFKRYPTSDECVQMIEKFFELDEKFKEEFEKRFMIDEIPDSREGLIIDYFNKKDESLERKQEIDVKNEEIRQLNEKLHQKDLLLQRILIDEHRQECEKLVKDWDEAVDNSNKCHEELEIIRAQLVNNPKDEDLNHQRKIAKDLWTDAKWQINLVRKKGLERIFGKNQEFINFEFLKEYVRKTFFKK